MRVQPENQKRGLAPPNPEFLSGKTGFSGAPPNDEAMSDKEASSSYTLESLLAGVTPENLHKELETGQAVGNEAW